MDKKIFITEGLDFNDMEGQVEPLVTVDEYAAKMGKDSDIVTLSFMVKSEQAGNDLVDWFERGYDFVLDADTSPGEIKPNRYLVYVEIRRRSAVPKQIQELLDDLSTLTEYDPDEWTMVYKGQEAPWSPEEFAKRVPLTPKDYVASTEAGLNEMRIAAGLPVKTIHKIDPELKALQAAAGI